MSFALLRSLDRWLGAFFLYLLALPMRLVALLPRRHEARPRYVFLKLKGGGSLIIALPMLLGLRRKHPEAEFILVCAREARIYAELTGIFDRLLLIDDSSLACLIASGWRALHRAFRASLCIDLEPNSLLAGVFTMLSAARQRIGLVRPEMPMRAAAYTSALPINPAAPIYIYYDQIAATLNAPLAAAGDCRAPLLSHLPPPPAGKLPGRTLGIVAFTSDFAPERMMPAATWAALLKKEKEIPARLYIFGSKDNRAAAQILADALRPALPACEIIDISGSYSLAQSAAMLAACDEIWAVDSGLLHMTRALGVPNRSFWGPTMPSQRLRPIDGLREEARYRPFICSPCVQASGQPPCGGHNLCMISMAEENPNLHPAWVQKQ
ncbi:MAG: glycosyltransferase family 9 protein [Alphaproteobacteria bacterium]|nr:glycosyltransferase family 9 protein [Alphaproteobacteria bacterium]